ncbi:unnamed protein product [Vicia faba]|uniref:Uncharacterized protein n=1 Tax=Vicia faba TaxID=3906 RepID=A0AAV0ZVC0_VICFA|nr:unnamed protein product [Vicia faba]
MNFGVAQSLSFHQPCSFSYDHFFHVLTTSFDMDNSQLKSRKNIGDNSTMWADYEKLVTVYAFVGEGGLDHAFTEVGLSLDWGWLPPEEDKRMCSKYECLFSLIDVCLLLMTLR